MLVVRKCPHMFQNMTRMPLLNDRKLKIHTERIEEAALA